MKEYIGYKSVANLKEIIASTDAKSIFLVTGKSSYESLKQFIEPQLSGCRYVRFYDFENNPKLTDIIDGAELFKSSGCDMIIAVGGGSAIDVAKSINIFAANPGKPLDYVTKKKSIQQKGVPLVAVPTTSGSGSEATHFAVIYVDKTKYSLTHKELMLPNFCIVDPQLTMTLPKKITAETGLDALSQAIESYWSVNSTEESQKYSKEAIRLIIRNLPLAVNAPNIDSRVNMAIAAHLAGKAINIAQTTACHAVSYPITSYFGVAHGYAAALTLGAMIRYNSEVTDKDINDKRGVEYIQNTLKEIIYTLGAKDAAEAEQKISTLITELGLSPRLKNCNIDKIDIELIIKHGFNPERVKNNPRMLDEEQLKNILNKIL